MDDLKLTDAVGEAVANQPALACHLERLGIDYGCNGKKTLEDACLEIRLEPRSVLSQLRAATKNAPVSAENPASMTLTELADCIERTHHAYLCAEIPRLNATIDKVCAAHGEKDARLEKIRDTFLALAREMASHMMKEEQILFPMIRQLEASETLPHFHCGSLANPIRQMEAEHDRAGAAIRSLRQLTGGFTPPDWACSTYKTMLNALSILESDMRQHVHKENNVLFPRAMKLEEEMGGTLNS